MPRACIMHNGGIPDRVIANTIDILPLPHSSIRNPIHFCILNLYTFVFLYFRQTFRVIGNTVDILTALSRDPIQWNAKSQLQCIFHCIAIHFTRVQAFPSDCNTFDQKCNPMCCIEFNLIQSERIKCDLYCVQRSLYDLPKCTSCVQEPIVLLRTSLAVHLFAEEIFFLLRK